MILAIDVHYEKGKGFVAGLAFDNWCSAEPLKIYKTVVNHVAEYKSGQFYKRELPCILALLSEHEITPKLIIIDGYVTLGEGDKPGLGMYLYEALKSSCPIVGVAKNSFNDSDDCAKVYRGESKKPLYVTCIGITIENTIGKISSMHGAYREPTLLKMTDRVCRDVSKFQKK